jgi:hypothetical protein
MALGEIVEFSQIPFFDHPEIPGRFVTSVMFYNDAGWRVWLQTEGNKFVEVQAWPAETFYFGTKPEQQDDIYSVFLTLLAQRINYSDLKPIFSGIADDYFNLSASLEKLKLIAAKAEQRGAARMAATEVEYLLSLCRSLFDLLQEVIEKLWDRTTLTVPNGKKRALKQSFSDMVLHANTPRTAQELCDRFGIPPVLADCYAKHAPLFLKLRQFRDNLVHRGYQVQAIFAGDGTFLIRRGFGPFRPLNIWYDPECQPNDLVPLMPALHMLVYATISACEEFGDALFKCIKFPPPIVPDMALFMRGYFNATFMEMVRDAEKRLADGLSLESAPQ